MPLELLAMSTDLGFLDVDSGDTHALALSAQLDV